jgi:tetratricopeptide (TPR) repeat protein
MSRYSFLCIIFCGLALVGLSAPDFAKLEEFHQRRIDADREVLYLPSEQGLQWISFGYKNALADLLWFSTVSYFGKHFGTDKKYIWLSHMCNLVLELDPQALPTAKFCSAMLSWEAGQAQESVRLLSKVIRKNPHSWELYSLRGFTNLLFLKDSKSAGEDFRSASKFVHAPILIKRLATRDLAIDDPDTAIEYISELIRTAGSEQERRVLHQRLQEAVFASLAKNIRRATAVYKKRYGKYPPDFQTLESAGIIQLHNLQDPFGGELSIHQGTGELESTKWKRPKGSQALKAIDERLHRWKSEGKGS